MKPAFQKESVAAQTLRVLFLELAHGLTKHHDDLTAETNQSGNFVTLTPTVHAEDAGKLVGRAGQNFNAMRTLLQFAADKLNVRLHLSRVKDKPGTRMPDFQPRFENDPNWPRAEIDALIKSACAKLFTASVLEWEHGKDKSVAIITVPEDERFIVPKFNVEECLGTLFAAIGNNCGRKLGVRLELNENLNQTKFEINGNFQPSNRT